MHHTVFWVTSMRDTASMRDTPLRLVTERQRANAHFCSIPFDCSNAVPVCMTKTLLAGAAEARLSHHVRTKVRSDTFRQGMKPRNVE